MTGFLKAERTHSRKRRCGAAWEYISPFGMTALLVTLTVPDGAGERRVAAGVDRCVEILRSARVGALHLAHGFPYGTLLRDAGFAPPDCSALLRLRAGEILASACPVRRRALVCARSAGRATAAAIDALAGAFRYVTLELPPAEFERAAAVVESVGLAPERLCRDGTSDADAALFFARPNRPIYLPAGCRCLFAGTPPFPTGGREVERVEFLLPERWRGTLPASFAPAPILSQALDTGRILPEDVKIASVT